MKLSKQSLSADDLVTYLKFCINTLWCFSFFLLVCDMTFICVESAIEI